MMLSARIRLESVSYTHLDVYKRQHPDVLKRYRELGGEIITVGADGHCPEHIAWDFDKANGILQACGFTYYTEFKQRKPVFKQLS